ncbi:MAG TPA: four helix bundle protein [bacterium]
MRKSVSNLVRKFPVEEKFRLADQIIRSSHSVAANIAEGFGRFHYQENIQFCRQARGSLSETLEHLICAFDEGFIDQKTFEEYQAMIARCLKLLNGYIAYLKKAKNNQ